MMSKRITDYAKHAALAEQRILTLLDGALREGLVVDSSKVDLRKTAPRQGHKSSGRLN